MGKSCRWFVRQAMTVQGLIMVILAPQGHSHEQTLPTMSLRNLRNLLPILTEWPAPKVP